MLTSHDAELCGRDRALPGLRLLLDPEAFVAAVRAVCPERAIGPARPTYLRYKPGLSCLAAYALAVGDREFTVHAHAYSSEAREKYSKLTGPDEVSCELGWGHMLLPEHGLVVSVFPNDRMLKALRRLATEDGLARLLKKMDPPIDPRGASLRVLSYKPERRMVARLDVDGAPRAIVRVYTETAYEQARHNARTFASHGNLGIAGYLAKSDWQQTLVLQYLEGDSLDRFICGADYPGPGLVEPVADALAELHAQGAGPSAHVQPAARYRATLCDLAKWVGFVLPEVARHAAEVAGALSEALAAVTPQPGFAHGDFYASQVLIGSPGSGGTVGVLDLDEAHGGDPYMDLATFAAHLTSDAIRGHVPRDRATPLIEAFNQRYARATRRTLSRHLPLYTAVAMFRLLPHPFRRREADWPARTAALLAGIEEMLQGGVASDA